MTRDTRIDFDDISHGLTNIVAYRQTDIVAKAHTPNSGEIHGDALAPSGSGRRSRAPFLYASGKPCVSTRRVTTTSPRHRAFLADWSFDFFKELGARRARRRSHCC